jgi:hypothetical protein
MCYEYYTSYYASALKTVDAFSERQTLKKNRRRCPLHRGGRSARRGRTVRGLVRGAVVLSAQGRTVRGQGPDGPRPGAQLRLLCLTAGRSAPWGRTVRVYAEAAEVAGSAWISLPGGTPSGRRDPRWCLGSGRPT